ncbi:MAG: transcriptional regulator [Bacteroidota bacterium]
MVADKIIKTEKEYEDALRALEGVFDAKPGTSEAEKAELLVFLISKYEDEKYPIPEVEPVEAIKFVMEAKGLKQKDLIPIFGSKSLVSEVLNKKRDLTLKIIKSLHENLNIPYELLIA